MQRALLALSAAILIAAPALTPLALAQNGDRFSAIAFSPSTNAYGTVADAASQAEAEAAALARCALHADDCENINWSRNACSALAIDVEGRGGWGAAWGNDYREAAVAAHDTCREYNDRCQVYAWVCNASAAPQ